MASSKLLPPVATSLEAAGLSERSVFGLELAWTVILAISITILFFDWICQLPKERTLIWKRRKGPLGWAFLGSRYTALTFGIFYTVTYATNAADCEISRSWPFLSTLVGAFADATLVVRVYALYFQDKTVLVGLLALFGICQGAIFTASFFIQPVFLTQYYSDGSVAHVCFILPSSHIYAIACIMPCALHHTLLAMSVYRIVSKYGSSPPIIAQKVLQEQLLLVLAVCMTCYSAIICIFIPDFAFALALMVPRMSLIQVILARLVFHSRNASKHSTMSISSGALDSLPSAASEQKSMALSNFSDQNKGSILDIRTDFLGPIWPLTASTETVSYNDWKPPVSWRSTPDGTIGPIVRPSRPNTAPARTMDGSCVPPPTVEPKRFGGEVDTINEPVIAITTDSQEANHRSAGV